MGKKLILLFLILIFAFSSCSSDTKEPTNTNEGGGTEITDAYTVKFEIPAGYILKVYKSQDINDANILSSSSSNTYTALQSDGSAAKKDGTDQLNFTLVPTDSVDDEKVLSISISGTYNKCKSNPDLLTTEGADYIYRITQIQSDLVVSVSTVTPIKVTFSFVDTANNAVNDSKAAITVYDTQDTTQEGNTITATSETKVVYAKTSTGIISATGEEQVNFVVSTTFPDGWTFKEVKCDDTENYKNLKKDPEVDGSEMYYRITKITGDITVKIVYQALT